MFFQRLVLVGKEHLDGLQHLNCLKSLELIEEVRLQFMGTKGMSVPELIKADLALFAREMYPRYMRQVFEGDLIAVQVRVSRIHGPSIFFESRIVKKDVVVVYNEIKMVLMKKSANKQVNPVPDWFRDVLVPAATT